MPARCIVVSCSFNDISYTYKLYVALFNVILSGSRLVSSGQIEDLCQFQCHFDLPIIFFCQHIFCLSLQGGRLSILQYVFGTTGKGNVGMPKLKDLPAPGWNFARQRNDP